MYQQTKSALLLVVFLTLLMAATLIWARPAIRDAWLNEYPTACTALNDAADDCSLCHSLGVALNGYGVDLQANIDPGTMLPDFALVASMDSDGDGTDNGQEIANCTRPGGDIDEPPMPGDTGGLAEDSDGNFVLDVGGDVFVQLVFSKAAFRNLFVVQQPTTQPSSCTIDGSVVDQCYFDTGDCAVCPLSGGDVSCACLAGLTSHLGNFPAGTVFQTGLHVDNNDDGAVDFVYSSKFADNPDGFDHVRTFRLATGVWRLEWEDVFGGGDQDFNDMVVLIFVRPAGSDLGPAVLPGFGGSPQIRLLTNIAIDPLSIPINERRVRLTSVLSNFGAERDVAVCPMLNFSGTERTGQSYSYHSGNGIPDCVGTISVEPSVRWTIDEMQSAPPGCPEAPPPTLPLGDIVTVPAAVESEPGVLALFYESRLADIGDNLENQSPEEVRDRIVASDLGIYLDTLYDFGPGITALICPNGVDTWFTAAAASDVANVSYNWISPSFSIASPVTTNTALFSSRSVGSLHPITARVDIIWEDNLQESLVGHLEHDPPVREPFTLQPGQRRFGKLLADFPDDLPDGFLGQVTILVTSVSDSELLVASTYTYAKDATPPALIEVHSVRGDDAIDFSVSASDPSAGINNVRIEPTVDGALLPPTLLNFSEGDFRDETMFRGLVMPVFPENVLTASLTVGDEFFNGVSAGVPIAAAGPDQLVECTSPGGASVTLDATNSGIPPESPVKYLWEGDFGTRNGAIAEVMLGLGSHDIHLTLTDGRGFTSVDQFSVDVVDTTPPVLSVEVTPDELWPPNHRLVDIVATVSVQDACDPDPSVVLDPITSDEPDNARGGGDGNTENDIQDASFGTADFEFKLRSERQGSGDGRTYTVLYTATDASGNQAADSAEVFVPRNR